MPDDPTGHPGHPPFPPTRWGLIQGLHQGGPAAEAALAELCRHYWAPIFAFLRRQGKSREDAEDLTQGFFATLLADGTLTRATPERGRLRTFLLHALRQYLVDQNRHAGRLKRGGHALHLPLEGLEDGEIAGTELTDIRDPETLFHRVWAGTVLATAQARLRAGFAAADKSALLEALEPHLEAEPHAVPYRELAARLGTTDTALRLAVFRARQKLRALIEEEVARTLSHPDDVEDELRHLFASLS